MSMYNLVHGTNPAADWLLALLDLTREDVGRFRDAWVNKTEAGYEIAVYTRNGGGNRGCWRDDTPEGPTCDCPGCIMEYRLTAHPLYLRDADDNFDCTYATIFFRAPDEAKALLSGLEENRDPDAEWLRVLDALKEGKRPDVVERLKPFVEAVARALGGKGAA